MLKLFNFICSFRARFIAMTVIIVTITLPVYANIEIQKRRLEYIQQMIDEKLSELAESQQHREQVTRQLQIYRERVERFMYMIKGLTAKEHDLVMEIIDRTNRRDILKSDLTSLIELCNIKMVCLYHAGAAEHETSEKVINERYLSLMINANKSMINSHKSLLEKTKENLQQDRAQRRNIESERNIRELSSRSLQREISNLYTLIESISAEERHYITEVQQLERNRIAIEALIEQIQTDEEKLSFRFTNEKLLWPIKGQVESEFGQSYDETTRLTLINNGITITTNQQQEVKAVDFGIVVFAESFRSYGRMIIIDHLNGYFSLYAGNSNLLVAKGDDVGLGHSIAITGKNNSSDEKYTLHFEIRRKSQAVDPLVYLE